LTLIPPLVSYLFFESVVVAFALNEYEVARDILVGYLYPPVAENELEHMLNQPTVQVWWGYETWRLSFGAPPGRGAAVMEFMGMLHIMVLYFGTIVFAGYSFVRLISDGKANGYVVAISGVITAINITRAVFAARP
jgi:hypothetical protein